MKRGAIIFTCIAVAVLSAGCSKEKTPAKPLTDSQVFIEKNGAYTISVPSDIKTVTDAEDIRNMLPQLKSGKMKPDLMAFREGEILVILQIDMAVVLNKAGLGGLSGKDLNDMLKSYFKTLLQDDERYSTKDIRDHKTGKGVYGFLAVARSTGLHKGMSIFGTVHKKVLYFVRYEHDMKGDPKDRIDFKKVVDSLDFSGDGVAAARRKSESFKAAMDEYKKKMELSDRDGTLTGAWNGFAIPFKFALNFFRDKKNKFAYTSENHTKYTYWIGFVIGLVPGLIIFAGLMSDRK